MPNSLRVIDDEVGRDASTDYDYSIPAFEEVKRPGVQLAASNNLDVGPLTPFRDFDNG